jgi:hypothetical protein
MSLMFGQTVSAASDEHAGALRKEYVEPPFSVLDRRSGNWQARRRRWLAMGIESEVGRAAGLTFNIELANHNNTSVFDPVLCELAYRWWAPPGGSVLDPFAGGSVRGVVASATGHPYTGIDLSAPQIEANRHQAEQLCTAPVPVWHHGDSACMDDIIPAGEMFDMILTCPPYFDLEVYSNDPRDLSAQKTIADFVEGFGAIMAAAAHRLRPGRFAVVVISEARDKHGMFYGLVPATVDVMRAAGLGYYNEAILLDPISTAPQRAGGNMNSRKLVRVHQNVLVFAKGDVERGWEQSAYEPPDPQQALWDVATIAPAETPLAREIPATDPAPYVPGDWNYADDSNQDADRRSDDPPITATIVATSILAGPVARETWAPTPIDQHGDVWVKRDDRFSIAGVHGGKVRTCWALAQGATGLVTASSRSSPQANIVAHVARELGIPARLHIPGGDLGPELEAARLTGVEIVQHMPGYSTVIKARAADDADERAWRLIPFGMECQEAVDATASQVVDLPPAARIVVPVGSGMTLAGIVTGLERIGSNTPVVGVVVGADPVKRLDRWAPDWRLRATLVPSGTDYHRPADITNLYGVVLDPYYEAKCIPFVLAGDMLWVVGIRQTAG